MKILLMLKVRRGAGALAGVAEALNDRGFYVDEHKLIPRDEETAEIRVFASGEGDPERLGDAVRKVPAVIELMEVREVSDEVESARSERDTEAPPDPWVERVLRQWPDVLPVLKDLSAPLAASDCEHRLTCLGVDVGAVLYARRATSDPPTSVESGLKQIVVPALAEVAKTRAQGTTLRVIETELASSEQVDLLFLPVEEKPYCSFITGLVTGLLNAIPRMPRVRVEETRCLARGDHVCDFQVTEIR